MATPNCSRSGSLFPVYEKCIYDCTCVINVSTMNIQNYCNTQYSRNGSANAACFCFSIRCSLDCLTRSNCPTTSEDAQECRMLENITAGCDLGCAQKYPGGLSSAASSTADSGLVWDFSNTRCLSDIIEVTPAPTLPQVEKGGSISGVIVGICLGACVLCFGLALCAWVTFSHKKRRQSMEDKYGNAARVGKSGS